MVASIKKVMLLGVMVSCLGLLLYSMPEAQNSPEHGKEVVQLQAEEMAKVDF